MDQRAGSVAEQLKERLWRLPPGHPSSPYDSNGALRPPVPDYRQREQPLPGEGDYNRQEASPRHAQLRSADGQQVSANEQADRPELIDQGRESDGQAVQTWRQTVPSLKELWRKHVEKWPDTERPPIDRSRDEPGSWRGDSGFTLNPRDNNLVEGEYLEIKKAEEETTDSMLALERESIGQLTGIDHRLKEKDRFKEKVAAQQTTNPDADVHEVISSIRDGIRYTLQYQSHDYTDGVLADVEAMRHSGYELLKLKNLWGAEEYKGINSQWRDPATSQAFEVQFHTLISFEAKQLTHEAYERLRIMDFSDPSAGAQAKDLHGYQRTVSSIIPTPDRAMNIADYP